MSQARDEDSQRTGNFLQNTLHAIDLFGRPITFTYQKKENFTSSIGGCATIFVGLILVALFATEMLTVFMRKQSTFSLTNKNLPIISEPEILEVGDDEYFNFAFKLVDSDQNDMLLDPTIVNVTLDQEIYNRTTGKLVPTSTPISFGICGSDFDNVDKEKADQISIPTDYYCPKEKGYAVGGSFYSNDYRFLQISVKKCIDNDTITCDPDIDTKLIGARYEIAFVNNMIDFSDYEKPVSPYIADGNYWDIVPSLRKKSDLFVQRNHGSLNKGYVTSDPVEQYFFQLGTNKLDGLKPLEGDQQVLTINIRADDTSIDYGRVTYTLVDALAKIGGFYRIVFVAFYAILFMFLENMFFSSVMQSIYQVQTYGNKTYLTASEIEPSQDGSSTNGGGSMGPDGANYINVNHGNDDDNHGDGARVLDSHGSVMVAQNAIRQDTQIITSNIKEMQNNKDNTKVEDTMTRLKNMIFGREYFTYSKCDSIRYVLCACWRKENTIRKNKRYRKHKIYNIGRDKINKELDMVNIIKTIKQLRLMMKVMMPEYQRVLLKFNKTNIIDDTDSGSDSEDRDNIVRWLCSENPEIKEYASEKVTNALDKTKKHATELQDSKVMLGVVHKKIPDLSDDENDKFAQPTRQFNHEELKSRSRHSSGEDYKSQDMDLDNNGIDKEPLIRDRHD